MAAAGACRPDASAPAVRWEAERHPLRMQNRPIRWIIDDAFKFVQREIRRGNQYHLIVLDPPAYGHKPNGQAWKLENCWSDLLDGCLQLLSSGSGAALLWTGHSPLPSMPTVVQQIQTHSGVRWDFEYGRNDLESIDGRRLDQGYFVRAIMKD